MATALICDFCGQRLDMIRRAADDTQVEVFALPHGAGDWMRVNARGKAEHGRYVKLNGTALAAARAEGVLLYLAHTKEACRRA